MPSSPTVTDTPSGSSNPAQQWRLARRKITLAFRELHEQVPDIRAVGEPDMLLSAFIHGIKRLDCEFTAR